MERINEFEERTIKISVANLNNRENRVGGKMNSFRNVWDYNKSSNICVIGVPEDEEKTGRLKKYIQRNND